jgi:hypothetical protein
MIHRDVRPRFADSGDSAPGSVARMARFGVRLGSLAFARLNENRCKQRVERTGANGRERLLAFAMQKVVGSSVGVSVVR